MLNALEFPNVVAGCLSYSIAHIEREFVEIFRGVSDLLVENFVYLRSDLYA